MYFLVSGWHIPPANHKQLAVSNFWKYSNPVFMVAAIGEKKSSAIVAIMWKPLSSDRSDSKNTKMQYIRSPISRWLPPRVPRIYWIWHFLWKKCKNTTAFKQLGKHSAWVPIWPRPGLLDTFSAITAIMWKPSIATIFRGIFSAVATIVAITWKPGFRLYHRWHKWLCISWRLVYRRIMPAAAERKFSLRG